MLYMIKKWRESLGQDCAKRAFLTDHSKTFKSDLIMVLKINSYGTGKWSLAFHNFFNIYMCDKQNKDAAIANFTDNITCYTYCHT